MMWLLIVSLGGMLTIQPFQLKSECEAVRKMVTYNQTNISVCMEVQNVYRGGRP
jgi:hypothetical protein